MTVKTKLQAIAFFPGQGSQSPGMGKSLADRYKAASLVFEETSDALGFDVKKLCWDTSKEDLKKTENAQVAIFVTSIAAWRVRVEEIGEISVKAVSGHSLGSLTAAVAGGYLSLLDGVKLNPVQTQMCLIELKIFQLWC